MGFKFRSASVLFQVVIEGLFNLKACENQLTAKDLNDISTLKKTREKSISVTKFQVESRQVFEAWYQALDPLTLFLEFFGIGAHGKILLQLVYRHDIFREVGRVLMKLHQLVKNCYGNLKGTTSYLFYHNTGIPFLKSFHLPNVSGSHMPSLITGVKTFFNRPGAK